MTAILNELRALDDRFKRGELSRDEYSFRREAVLQSVETAETEFAASPPPIPRDKKPNGSSALTLGIVTCLGVMGLSIGLILLFLPDLNLALTLGVTVLAALSVALLRDPEG
ncbi:MAG: SHOCT domain-containing protein [Roseobacter sp.]